ncbi:MAG: helix-turn-helix transcriptional regulator, partial [Ruminococcaceae bacterium]|nr:helix-turn-helix transcriptional regulator [Oscillospiraceae bacterium]
HTIIDFLEIPRPISSLAVCDAGEAHYTSPDGDFILYPGDLLFIPQNAVYRVDWQDEPGQLTAFHFIMDYGDRRYSIQKLDILPEEADAVRRAEKRFRTEDDPFTITAGFYDACARFWDRLVWKPRPRIDPRIRPAVEYLERCPELPVTIAELAARCCLSEPHFYACFRETMGTSPIDYRRRLLVSRGARMLLESPALSIGDIAETLGFSSETYFRRVFHAVMSCSPREYRRRDGIL